MNVAETHLFLVLLDLCRFYLRTLRFQSLQLVFERLEFHGIDSVVLSQPVSNIKRPSLDAADLAHELRISFLPFAAVLLQTSNLGITSFELCLGDE